MKQTTNLKLNLFEGSDPVLAESFNENSQKLDAAVTEAKALTETRCTANQQLIASLSKKVLTVQTGSYTGNGENTKTLQFAKRPAFVILAFDGSMILCMNGCAYGITLVGANGGGVNKLPGFQWDNSAKTLTITTQSNTANLQTYNYQWTAFLCDEF